MKKERGKKILVSTLLVIFLFSLFSFLVFAQDEAGDETAETAAEATRGVISGIGGVASEILSPLFGEKEMLTRVFFAILLGMIIYTIIGTWFKNQRAWIKWTITGVITALALIALPSNFIEAIRAQYGAMGAAILSVIPFAILLVFSVRVQSALVGRVVWIFFVVYYFALYIYMIVTEKTGWISAETIPFFFAIIAGILIFFLLGPIRRALFYGEMDAVKESGTKVAKRAKLLHELQSKELNEAYGDESGN
jgi:hypothetical protein